jgi:glycosyltransferase
MKFSIITVAYNSSDTIQETLESVLSQTYCEIEYIVVDGQSQDHTVDIIKEYESRFNNRMQWISEPDQGIYDALNKGIRLATGDVIGFLHSDDVFSSANVLSMVQHAFEAANVDIVYGDLVYVKRLKPTKIIRYWESKPFKSSLIQRGWMPPHPTVFMRREVYQESGLYDPLLRISSDYDFLLRVLRNDRLQMVYLPQIIVKMRGGGTSNRTLKNILQKMSEDYRSLRRNNIPSPMSVLFLKNITKLHQLVIKRRL